MRDAAGSCVAAGAGEPATGPAGSWHVSCMCLAMDRYRADPRLIWLASVLAAATLVVFIAQQA